MTHDVKTVAYQLRVYGRMPVVGRVLIGVFEYESLPEPLKAMRQHIARLNQANADFELHQIEQVEGQALELAA
ncbi:MAG: hypothetical protein LPK02_07115 [Rhodobacterales bacterium]|nr:hypothetical protein [Rhodobacterales bacterium]